MEKNRLYRRIMAMTLSVVMLLGLLPVSAAAGTDVFDYANTPASGTMYLRVEIPVGGTEFQIPVCGNANNSPVENNYFNYSWVIDWGDVTASQTETGTSALDNGIAHTYDNAGSYTIAITPYGGTESTGWFRAFGFTELSTATEGPNASENKQMITGFAGVLDDTSLGIKDLGTKYACRDLFYGCSNLTAANIQLESGVTAVGDGFAMSMFEGCASLVSLPDLFNLPSGITSVGRVFAYRMFMGCESLTSLPAAFNLPSGIINGVDEAFAAEMFSRCYKLASLPDSFNLPAGITSAGMSFASGMFDSCESLTSLPTSFNLPSGMTSADGNFASLMFAYCKALTSLPANFNLPQNIETVGDNFVSRMFSGCKSLTSLPIDFNLPQNLTGIGTYFAVGLFEDCKSLKINGDFRFPSLSQADLDRSNVFANTFSGIEAEQYSNAATNILSNLSDSSDADYTKIYPSAEVRNTFSQAFKTDANWEKIHDNWKDPTPPSSTSTVVSVTPSGTDVALSGSVIITFSEAMDKTAGTVLLMDLTNYEETSLTGGSWSEDGKTYTVSYSKLAAGTTYRIFIDEFKDPAGSTVEDEVKHKFTTAAETDVPGTDVFDYANAPESGTMYLRVETPADGASFQIPVCGNANGTDYFNYSWLIDWGDETASQTETGTSAKDKGISHPYTSAGTYTIKITPSGTESTGWFRAFGFSYSSTAGASLPENKQMITGFAGVLNDTSIGFKDPGFGQSACADFLAGCANLTAANIQLESEATAVQDGFAVRMFSDCSSLVSLPNSFNLPGGITSVGKNFTSSMFYKCTSLTALPENFNLPQNLSSIGDYFACGMFNRATNLKINNHFGLPALTQAQINQDGVFVDMFENIEAKQYPGAAAAILSNLPDNTNTSLPSITKIFPNSCSYTFPEAFNNDVSWNKIHDNWKEMNSTYTPTAPTVGSVTPSGTDAALSGDIVITFSDAMTTDGSAADTVLLDNSVGALTGGTWSEDGKTYTVSYSGLTAETTYTMTISGFKDAAGNEMTADSTHTFTTTTAAVSDVFDYANTPESGTMYLRVETPTNNSQFGLPVCGASYSSSRSFEYNWVIDWGDGTPSQVKTGTSSASGRISHSYSSAGTYTVAIKPNGAVSDGWFRAFGADQNYNKFNMITGFAGVLDELSMNLSSGDYCAAEMFHGCAELTAANIRFQQNATTVGNHFADDMFFGCTALTSLPADFNLPQNLETVGTSFAYHMFDHCDALASLPTAFNLPQNITTAKDFFASAMFNNCGSLESLPTAFNLPQNLTTVGNNFANGMFAACTSLKSLPTAFNLPQNLTTVGYGFASGMFIGCTSLESLPTAFNLPQNLETVGDFFASEMFSGCTSLKSLSTAFNLPQKLPTVGASFASKMFYNCTSLESLPTGFNLSPNLTTVGNSFAYRMFYSCTLLKSLPTSFSLPQKLTTVGLSFAYEMFYNCRNLKINSAFRFPNLDQDQINQPGAFYRAFSEIAADQNIGEAAAILSNLTDNTNTDFSGITKIFPKDDRDTFSNAFNNDVSWNKIHANWKVTDSTYKDYPPTVGSVTPSGTDAALSGKVVVTFSEAMDTSTSAVGTVVLVDSTNGEETSLTGGSWSEDSKTYTVSYSGLTAEKTYFLFISGFKDAAGNVMDYDNSHTFTTAAASVIWDGTTKDKSWYTGHESDFSYIITTAEQLAGFEELVNGGTDFTGKTVTLGADIELNDVTNASSWNGETTGLHNWTAIGTYTKPFAGTFDGDGHTVSGIYIKSSDDRQALFGMVATGGTVKNLGVVDSYIQGDANVAGVVGDNSGTVENCYNKATVLGDNQNVGGIVGTNYNGTIKDCYNAGTVMGGYNYVGGLVGNNSGTIQGCYNTGDVTGIGGIGWIGGIAGTNKEGTITKCYNTGTVKGDPDSNVGVAGGIAGSNCSSIENCYNLGSVEVGDSSAGGVVSYNGTDSSVKNCYNAGSVTSTWEMRSNVGGVAGTNEGTISSCYYDNTVCTFRAISDADADAAGQAVGKATAWMQNATATSGVGTDTDTFSGWDPSVWGFKAGKYPDFHPLNVVSVTPGDTEATASGSIAITFSEAMDKAAGTVKLTNGAAVIALSGGSWSEDGKTYTISYSDLAYGTGYTVEIADFKAASDGSAMSADSTHTFTTKTVADALTGTATISGTAALGGTLTATLTDGNSTGTISYQWTRDGVDIPGATNGTYTLTKDDVGKTIAVKITSSDKQGTQTSAATDAVAKADCTATASVPVILERIDTSITLTAKGGYEYMIVAHGKDISTGTWQDSSEFTGLTAGTDYDIYQRVKETDTTKASDSSDAVTAKTKNTIFYSWNYTGAVGYYATQAADSGETLMAPATPERAGYTFGGWYKDAAGTASNVWNFKTDKVTAETTLYAKWNAKADVTSLEVTYAGGGATSGKAPKDRTAYKSGDTVTVFGNTGTFSKSGYSFAGWSDGTKTYQGGDTFQISGDTVLTAVWTENAKTFTVTYSSNYPGGKTVAQQTVEYGALLTKPAAQARDGYTFLGWYQDAACTKPWNFDLDTVTGTLTLYTKWTQATGTHTVSGTVQDDTASHATVEGATVSVMQGNLQFGNTVLTDASGRFTVTGVPDGEYNIVVTKDGQRVTLHFKVSGADFTYDGQITLPSGNTNSKLDIIGADTPNIVENGLADLFKDKKIYGDEDSKKVKDGGTVEIRLTVQKDENSKEKEKVTAQMSSAGYKTGPVFTVDLEKTVIDSSGALTDQSRITALDSMLTLIVPLPGELQGKSNYVIYRTHDYGDGKGVKIDTITKTPNANGEHIEISADGTFLTLHAKFFSTYAIGYSESSGDSGNNGGSSSSGGSGSSSDSKQSYSFTVTSPEGGSISPSGTVKVVKGPDQTFTFTPKKGYAIAQVLIDGKSVGVVSSYTFSKVDRAHTIEVIFVKAEGLPYYVDGNGGKVFIGFASSASGEMKYIAPEGKTVEFMQNPKYFTDISGHWAKSSIDFITQREIFMGTKANAFLPDTGMTRAMFAAVIGRLYERSYGAITETENTFSDVRENAYYAKYVSWAEKNGIIMGINENQFAPNREITRQQMAAILYRFAQFLKVSGESAKEELDYSDSTEIGAWAVDAVKYCQKNGIILGRSDGNFAPRNTASRAEVATILKRFVETVVS